MSMQQQTGQEYQELRPWLSPSIPQLLPHGMRTLSEFMFDYVDRTDNLPSGQSKMARYDRVARIGLHKRHV